LAEQNYERREDVYRRGGEGPYPWDLGRPRDFLMQLLEGDMIEGVCDFSLGEPARTGL